MTRDEALAEAQALQEQFNPRTGDWLSDAKLILLRFLRDVFHQAPREVAGQLGKKGPSFHWEESDSETELFISDKNTLDTDTVGARPAIIVSRGSFKYGNIAIDQMLRTEPSTGVRVHTDLMSGVYTVHCVAEDGRVAEILAQFAARAIRVYRRELQRAGFHLIGNDLIIGEETDAGALFGPDVDSKYRDVPVLVPAHYQDMWTVTPNAVVLAGVKFKLLAVAARFGGGLVDPDSVDEQGRPIEGHPHVTVIEWTLPEGP
jgi:hypothetical protein